MEGILGIIFIVVIGLISVIAKSNKKRGDANQDAESQPQRSVPLSDIQRAFMMVQDNTLQQPPQAAPRPAYAPPQAAQRPAYTPAQPATYTPMESRTVAPMQGRAAAPMESRMAAPLQSRMAAPMEARTSATAPPYSEQAAVQPDAFAARQQTFVRETSSSTLPQDFYSGSMGSGSREGLRDTEGNETPLVTVRNAAVESVADVDLETLSNLDTPVMSARKASPEMPVRKGLPIKLFENKNEFVKAVIYSEVLARKTPGHTRRA
jgi:hypothetical protein